MRKRKWGVLDKKKEKMPTEAVGDDEYLCYEARKRKKTTGITSKETRQNERIGLADRLKKIIG